MTYSQDIQTYEYDRLNQSTVSHLETVFFLDLSNRVSLLWSYEMKIGPLRRTCRLTRYWFARGSRALLHHGSHSATLRGVERLGLIDE